VPQDAPEGLCPRCLGALNLDPETGLTGGGAGGQFANADAPRGDAGTAAIAEVLHEMLLPILDSIEAIKKIDDPELQRRAAQALLRNFPHLETVILHNKALANKLLPELTAALVAGLIAEPKTT